MPTGYTADLHDGTPQTFPEFAMACARAFGATITMRDDAADATIPDQFEPSTTYLEWWEQAVADNAMLDLLTLEQWAERQEAEIAEALAARDKIVASSAEIRARYEGMLAQVEGWSAPTADHTNFKEFMINQLRESIKFDCTYVPDVPDALTSVEEYREIQLEAARARCARYHAEWMKEQERAAGRTAWVNNLRASLPTTPTTTENPKD